MFKLKYYFYTILLLLFISFPNKSFSDNHNLKEVIELMQKDLSTLERAVYSENFSLNQQSNNTDINMDQNSEITIVLEGHADERGTREYNLALGERRANAAKDYLMTYGISSSRISVISYGKERPVDSGSSPLAWSKNRRSVTVKAN